MSVKVKLNNRNFFGGNNTFLIGGRIFEGEAPQAEGQSTVNAGGQSTVNAGGQPTVNAGGNTQSVVANAGQKQDNTTPENTQANITQNIATQFNNILKGSIASFVGKFNEGVATLKLEGVQALQLSAEEDLESALKKLSEYINGVSTKIQEKVKQSAETPAKTEENAEQSVTNGQ